MKKEYTTPTIIARNVCMSKHYMIVLSPATTKTSANHGETQGWDGGNYIDVTNDEMPADDPWDDFMD